MSDVDMKAKRENRLKRDNSHHSSHRHDVENRRAKMEAYNRDARVKLHQKLHKIDIDTDLDEEEIL